MLFASFSGKRRSLLGHFLGGKPPTPVVPLRGRVGFQHLLRSRTTLFASFSGKRRHLEPLDSYNGIIKPIASLKDRFRPQTQGRLRRGLGSNWSSAKQNYGFCFFFWKKKEY
jgi:hypothetical protein